MDETARCADAIASGESERTKLESEARAAKDEAESLGVRIQELRAKDASGLIEREKAAALRSDQAGRKAVAKPVLKAIGV